MTAFRMTGLAVALGLASGAAQAEEILFKCLFDGVCDPDRSKCESADLDLRFKVDTEANTVTRLGGNTTSRFSLILGDRALTMLEVPISGGTATTTVLMDGGWAVHSDNGFEGANLSPKQFFGECQAL
ncbi:hypothetical protein [Aliiroseovarius subalbicans]|uniref:hypothetical protein n=1 Tax=Aliiroseovarius subalbicans TaxID=2925840 RepID=UPI001F56C402|nr:hypothetical protein [Aliiroseovarius subalbicans]MCI2398329.1 hypothetical protein [Aliiroseovarius subalbicans]